MANYTLVTFDGKPVQFRSNSDVQVFWRNGKMFSVWRDGLIQTFNKYLCSVKAREGFEDHGIEQRMADTGAIEIDKIPNKLDRVKAKQEARARLIEHYQSGTDDWSPKAKAGGGLDIGLVIRALIDLGYAADVDAAELLFLELSPDSRDEGAKMLAGAKDVSLKMAELRIEGRPAAVSAADIIAAMKAKAAAK